MGNLLHQISVLNNNYISSRVILSSHDIQKVAQKKDIQKVAKTAIINHTALITLLFCPVELVEIEFVETFFICIGLLLNFVIDNFIKAGANAHIYAQYAMWK